MAEAEKAGITGRVGTEFTDNADAGQENEVKQPPSDPRFDAAEAALEAGDWAKAIDAYKESCRPLQVMPLQRLVY